MESTKKRSTSPSQSIRNKIDRLSLAAMFKTNDTKSQRNITNPITTTQPQTSNIITKEEIEKELNTINTIFHQTQNKKQNLEQLKISIGILLKATKQSELYGYSSKEIKQYASDALTHAEHLKNSLDRVVVPTKSQSSRVLSAPNRTTTRSRSNLNVTKSNSSRTLSNRDELSETVLNEMYIPLSSIKSTSWEDIAGLNDCKRALQEAIILPILRPDLYNGLRSPAKGILLYGPPGTGKTMLAKAAAYESKSNFFSCSASSLTSKWHGESEKLLKTLFDISYKYTPCILFFDELDALLSTRNSNEHEASRRFKTEFMIRMDGIVANNTNGNVLVLGCTNCPWDIDQAVLRRFQRCIYVPLPDDITRRAFITKMISSIKHSLSSNDVDTLVQLTQGYSCSDIQSIGRDASFGPLRKYDLERLKEVDEGDVQPVGLEDFREAVGNTKRSVGKELLGRYSTWQNDLG